MLTSKKLISSAILFSLGLPLTGCSTPDFQKSGLESIHQPVITRNNYTFDVISNGSGLTALDEQRLSEWFRSMDLRYGDRVSVDDPTGSQALQRDVNAIAGRFGLMVSDGAPVTSGQLTSGSARIVITRSTAAVPGCPDWSENIGSSLSNQAKSGFGCAVNSNLASMVANPEDLVRGASDTGKTTIMSSNKAIDTYRKSKALDPKDLAKNQTTDVGN